MAVTFELPPDVEKKLRAETPDVDRRAKEAFAIELFRRGRLTHAELSQVLGIDRFDTDALLKRCQVFQGSQSSDDIQTDRDTLARVLGTAPT